MQLLKERIVKDGVAIGTEIVKVDSFLNHQIDVLLVDKIGEEFYARFKDQKIDKILTIEASGIAVACSAARLFGVPVIFAKKSEPSTMVDGTYQTEVKSFTKNKSSRICVSKNYISAGEKILIIDDFLAHGEALTGLADLVGQAGAITVGAGIVIEKQFQGGGDQLRQAGLQIESLAKITAIKDGVIYFAD